MARVELGPEIRAISGKLGNVVYQTQRGIQVVKSYQPRVSQPGTQKQQSIRAIWTEVTQAWRNLDADHRAMWAAYAKSKPLGLISEMTVGTKPLWKKLRGPLEAHSAFFRTNALLRYCGFSIVSEPPSDPSVPIVVLESVEMVNNERIHIKGHYEGMKAMGQAPAGAILFWVRPPDPCYAAIQHVINVSDDAGSFEFEIESVEQWGRTLLVSQKPGDWHVQARAIRIDGQISAPSERWTITSTAPTPPEFAYWREVQIGGVSGTWYLYQVQIELTSENFDFSHVRADGGDIRFYWKEMQLPYWIELWDYEAQHARIWVRVPVLDADGTTITMKYGNPALEREDDPYECFDFFEDFQVGSRPFWREVWETHVGNNFELRRGRLRVEAGSRGVFHTIECTATVEEVTDGTIRTRTRYTAIEESGAWGVVFRWRSPDEFYAVLFAPAQEVVVLAKATGNWEWEAITAAEFTPGKSSWIDLEVTFEGNHFTVNVEGETLIDTTDDTFTEAGAVGCYAKWGTYEWERFELVGLFVEEFEPVVLRENKKPTHMMPGWYPSPCDMMKEPTVLSVRTKDEGEPPRRAIILVWGEAHPRRRAFRFRAKLDKPTQGSVRFGIVKGNTAEDVHAHMFLHRAGQEKTETLATNGEDTLLWPLQHDYTGEWYTFEIRRRPRDGHQTDWTDFHVVETGETLHSDWTEEGDKMITLQADARDQYVHVDWVAVRKAAYQDPTVTVGEEHEY